MKNTNTKLQETNKMIQKFESRLKFSFINLLFFSLVSMFLIYNTNQIYFLIISLVVSVIFVQQTIYSYNYLKFYIYKKNVLELFQKEIEKVKGGK